MGLRLYYSDEHKPMVEEAPDGQTQRTSAEDYKCLIDSELWCRLREEVI